MVEELAKAVIAELREKRKIVFQPTADIDMIWVISGPGTYDSTPNTGLYKGLPKDKERIDAGVGIVRQVTALRFGVGVSEITKEMIGQNGPVFYYNGEEFGQGAFPQNPSLRDAVAKDDFPLPPSKVVIRTLTEIFTPGQIKDLVAYLKNHLEIKKIAVVTHGPHQRRVARYVQKYMDIFPPGIAFVDAAIPEKDVAVGGTLGEIKRIVKYVEKGDLSVDPNY